MRLLFVLFLGLILCHTLVHCQQKDSFEDDDFAEFEEFDADDEFEEVPVKAANQEGRKPSQSAGSFKDDDFPELDDSNDDEDGIVEDDNEFEHFQDEEEFEGFAGNSDQANSGPNPAENLNNGEPKLTMAKVPLHFRTHWDSYWLEMLMIAGLMAYFSNYIVGRSKNSRIVNNWLSTHRSLLEDNFVLVGDDGKLENESHGLIKESENHYTLWCSGRTCCEGMLVELKLIKRQDLVSIISGLMKPVQDQLILKAELSKDVFDSFVFCLAAKKTATKLFKEQNDLNKFCMLVTKSEEKYKVPAGYSVLSEIPEASSAVLDTRLIAALNKYPNLVEYIHISDQFTGAIQQEDPSNLKQPDVKKMLIAAFNLPSPKDMDPEVTKPMLILVFYLMERMKRFRLSKEGKQKADKNRQRVEEEFLKSTHAARAEAAAQRKEEKRKQEKERVLADDDPEKQRRWEKKEQKREQKKKAPRMKKLSIKAM